MYRRSARSSRQQNEQAGTQGKREVSLAAVQKVRATPKKKPVNPKRNP
jgi:hypothetical protein